MDHDKLNNSLLALKVFLGLTFLLLPVIIPSLPGYSPRDKWYETPKGDGNFSFMANEIYEKNEPIDILVLGSSLEWVGIDTNILAKEFEQSLGSPVIARNFGSNWRQEELLYLIFKEVLEHRKVKMLVLGPPKGYMQREHPHEHSYYWWIYGEHYSALSGLNLQSKLQLYGMSLLGSARHLLSLCRNNLYQISTLYDSPTGSYQVPNNYKKETQFKLIDQDFKGFMPNEVIYSDLTQKKFHFGSNPPNNFQNHFFSELIKLAEKNNVKVVLVSVPLYSESNSEFVEERFNWLSLAPQASLIGIPGSKLFEQVNKAGLNGFFYDAHLNRNGASLFTRAIAPALISIYEK